MRKVINPLEYIGLDYKFPFEYICRYYSDNIYSEVTTFRNIGRRIYGISILIKYHEKV